MKKILSLILACAMCFSVMSISAFADTQTSDGLFGVITDADGNVVEVLKMTRDVYLNKIYTIPAKGAITTYQYEPTWKFFFGFTSYDMDSNIITDSRCEFDISIEASNSIGAVTRETVAHSTYDYEAGALQYFKDDGPYRYFNGKLINTSSVSATVRVIVALNGNPETIFPYPQYPEI